MVVVYTALGVIGLLIFIPCVIALAAAVTWGVVRIFPLEGKKAETPKA